MKNITLLSFIILIATITNTGFAFSENLEPFDEIILFGNVSALLVEGEQEAIEIRNDEDQLEVEVIGHSLKVKTKNLIRYNKTPTVKIIITYKKVRTLKVRAGASAFSENPIKGDKLRLRFSSGASGEIIIDQNFLEVSVSEGGNLKLKGKTDWQEVKVSTGGTLSAYKLDCNKTVVKANTGGDVKLVAYESIDASANTGGSITYKGDPKKVREKDGFSGSVRSW